MQKVPKCKECEYHKRKMFFTSDKPYHDCVFNCKTICYGDKLPKARPSWCRLRKIKGDKNANKI